MMIRPAKEADLGRIAEIEVFNYRLNFYPIFRDDDFYFSEMTVVNRMDAFRNCLDELWVYDDGVVKAFMQVSGMQRRSCSSSLPCSVRESGLCCWHMPYRWVLTTCGRWKRMSVRLHSTCGTASTRPAGVCRRRAQPNS